MEQPDSPTTINCLKVQGKPVNTIEFLQTNRLDEIKTKNAIRFKRHPKHSNLIQFHYMQAGARWQRPMVRECRGLILDEKDNWKVISYPYAKFFNYGERYRDHIDWSTVKVYEKLDGSIMTLYYYKGEWFVSTSSIPDASVTIFPLRGAVKSEFLQAKETFADVFWEVWNKSGYKLPDPALNRCYMFELLTARNQIIVVAKTDRIVLHGVRDLNTFNELDPITVAKKNNWEHVKIYPFKDLASIINATLKINPAEDEGFVVCDANFARVKVKAPQYVALATLSVQDKNKMNQNKMLEIVKVNEGSEFLSYFPEWRELYDKVKKKFDYFKGYITQQQDKIKGVEVTTDAQWAELARKYKFQKVVDVLKGLKNNGETVDEYFAKMNGSLLVDLMQDCGVWDGSRSKANKSVMVERETFKIKQKPAKTKTKNTKQSTEIDAEDEVDKALREIIEAEKERKNKNFMIHQRNKGKKGRRRK